MPTMSRWSLVMAGAILSVSVPFATAQIIGAPRAYVDSSTFGPIPDSPAAGCGMPGRPRDVKFRVYGGDAGVATANIWLALRHPAAGQLSVTLIAPDGASHVVFGRPGANSATGCGSTAALDGAYEFLDDGADFWSFVAASGSVVPYGRFAASTAGGTPDGGATTRFATALAGIHRGGVWTLRIVDWGGGGTGVVDDARLDLSYPLLPGIRPDEYRTRRGVPLTIDAPGPMANDDVDVTRDRMLVEFEPPRHGHFTFDANGSFVYTPDPDFAGDDAFRYFVLTDAGVGYGQVTIRVQGALPPTDLEVASIVGDRVILRWRAPEAGLPPTEYLLAWYSEAGEPLGAMPVPGDVTALALTPPPGIYRVAMQTQSIAGHSEFSRVLRVNTGAPEMPAAPARPIVGGQGDAIAVAWSPSFAAGVPRRTRVDIGSDDGERRATFEVEAEHLVLPEVPAGTYFFSLSQANETGIAGVSLWHSLTVPRTCRPPAVPGRVGVFKGPGRLGAVWDPSPEGDAPEAYDVSLAGAWEGQVALPPSRVHETELSAGVYSLRVRARNVCGVSPWTAVQTVAVP